MMLSILGPNWNNDLLSLLKTAKREVFIVVPYFTRNAVQDILTSISRRVTLKVLVGFQGKDILYGAVDYNSLLKLVKNAEVRYLQGVHAKVYVADSAEAIVTSSNLTTRGLKYNLEIGVRMFDKQHVAQLIRLLNPFWEAGKPLLLESLPSSRSIRKAIDEYNQENRETAYDTYTSSPHFSDLLSTLDEAPRASQIGQSEDTTAFQNADTLIPECMPTPEEIEMRFKLLNRLRRMLHPSKIKNLTRPELKRMLKNLNERFGAIHRINIVIILGNQIDRIRRSLMYLLWGDDDDLERLKNMLYSEAWHLNGVAIGVLSAFLMVKNPDHYPLYNENVRYGLEYLKPGLSLGKEPEDYLYFSQQVDHLKRQYHLPSTAVDWVLWEISKRRQEQEKSK